MAQQYHPKPISWVPPILKRKFIAPDNPREMGTLVMLIGLAVIVVSGWSGVSDTLTSIGKRSAIGTKVAEAPFRSGNAARMVGVYLFEDEAKVLSGVRGDRVYTNKAKVAKQARVVWPKGRPQKAQVVFEKLDYLLGVPIGFGIFGFGIWIRRKRVDAFEEAMGRTGDSAEPNEGQS